MKAGVLDLALGTFLDVLRSGWVSVGDLAALKGVAAEVLRADWAQANWEAIVEAAVSEGHLYIEPYGDGADCNSIGSRVWMPGAKSTHVVSCYPLAGISVVDRLLGQDVTFPGEGLPVDRFACLTDEGWYEERPPFDHVLTILPGGREALFLASDMRFALRPVS